MSALSTPSGGGTTAQNKPTSGKQKYQKLDINSLYCANKNENSEPSSVKSQLSRKHGMQSLGKVPSARRPPANLPSLKTETGQDTNTNSISATTTTPVSTPATCSSQTISTCTSSSAVASAAAGAGGWVSLPPPSSPHFRTEFPSLEASAQQPHRTPEQNASHLQLRPQTEGSWTSGGSAGARQDVPSGGAPPPTNSTQETPYRAILPSFLIKGSSSGGLGLGSLGTLRDNRSQSSANASSGGGQRSGARGQGGQGARAAEVVTTRPILREEQINSLDDIARDAGWAQHDDIDYNQKLNFSDGESSPPISGSKGMKMNVNDRTDSKIHDAGDDEKIWAELRQKQNDEVAVAVARARQRKEEGQRRQSREGGGSKDGDDKERYERPRYKEKEYRDYPRDNRDSKDNRDVRDNNRDVRDNNRDNRDIRDNNRDNRDVRDNNRDNRDSRESRDRDNRDSRESRDRDNRDLRDNRDMRDNRDRDNRDIRDNRDVRENRDNRDIRDNRDNRDTYNKTFQSNLPPRFLKQQQNRQEDNKGWAYQPKQDNRRPDNMQYNAPRHAAHNGRRSFSRDFSDREDDNRREKEGSGPQWRSEMQEYDRSGRDLERQSSKDSYKDFGDYKDKRNEERKSVENSIDTSCRTSAADKLTEVFERKSIGVANNASNVEHTPTQIKVNERRSTPPSSSSQRESSERDFGKTSWAEASLEECSSDKNQDKNVPKHDIKELTVKEVIHSDDSKSSLPTESSFGGPQNQSHKHSHNKYHTSTTGLSHNHHHSTSNESIQSQATPSSQSQSSFGGPTAHHLAQSKSNKDFNIPVQKQSSSEHIQILSKPVFGAQKSDKDFSESESIASKSSTDPLAGPKTAQTQSVESLHCSDHKRSSISNDDKKSEISSNDQLKISKEPIDRKSSGSGSDKKGARGWYPRGWSRGEGRGRRSQRSSRSNHRVSESDASTDGNNHPRSPRRVRREPPAPPAQTHPALADTREPFAPRGQPSRRGRGGFQGAMGRAAPSKRVAAYGPPNTKSPFSQSTRAKDTEESKETVAGDGRQKPGNKPRTGSSVGRDNGRNRRQKPVGAPSGEDDNWETTSEHSEGGGPSNRRRSLGQRPNKGAGGRNQNSGSRPNTSRVHNVKKDGPSEITEVMTDLKITKKDDEVVDDGFQEVRNKKNSKDAKVSSGKEDNNAVKQTRSHSNQGGGRNSSSSRNPNDKPHPRGQTSTLPVKSGPQYDRPRQPILAPRFVKQRQKQQMGIVGGFTGETGEAPPPPPVNAWDKPLRACEEPPSSAPSPPAPRPLETPNDPRTDAAGVLDGTTPPVETIIFENTNYKSVPPAEPIKQKYPAPVNATKPSLEETTEIEARSLPFNGEVRLPPRSIQELIADSGRSVVESDSLAIGLAFETSQKQEDSSDMKLDFAFDSDLGQLTEEKTVKSIGLPRAAHMNSSNTISPLAADLNLKIQSVKKVWEMPAVTEGGEELQFAGFEESGAEAGAPPNVCKVKPTQQLQSPPPQHYSHVGYQGGYGGLQVPSPPAVLYNSAQQLLGSSQQLTQQGGLYGAFLDQTRGQFGGFHGTPYGAGSAPPYNYQPPPDMFQSLQSQYRMAGAGGGAAFGQSAQLPSSPSTVLISSTSNSLMSATVKPTSQQIGAIGSKGGGVSQYQQQYVGYGAAGVAGVGGEYSLVPRPGPGPGGSSYYPPYTPPAAPQPSYPLQFPQTAQSAFGSQLFSTQLQAAAAAAAVQQMQQQYRGPMQQQFATRPPVPAQLKSPLHEHANGFSGLESSPKNKKPPHSPHSPPHKYTHPPPHHHQHHHQHQQHHQQQQPQQHHQQQQQQQQHQQQVMQQYMVNMGNNGRCMTGGTNPGGVVNRGSMQSPRYPSPIQRPLTGGGPLYRGARPPAPPPRHSPHSYFQGPRGESPHRPEPPPHRPLRHDAGDAPPPVADTPHDDAAAQDKPE